MAKKMFDRSKPHLNIGHFDRSNAIAIHSNVTLANMFGCIYTSRSMSSGRVQFAMPFSHYEPVPPSISEEIQARNI